MAGNIVKVGVWTDEMMAFLLRPPHGGFEESDFEVEVQPQTAARWREALSRWQIVQVEIASAIALCHDGAESRGSVEPG
jgi:hypothetical protein